MVLLLASPAVVAVATAVASVVVELVIGYAWTAWNAPALLVPDLDRRSARWVLSQG
jgi:hypothetical protein